MTTRHDEAEIDALFDAYAIGFDDADPQAVTALFAWPTTIWQSGTGHVFADADELSENVGALIDVFDEAGITRTQPTLKEVRVAGEAAFADVAWRQSDDAGETLHAFSCQYLLMRQDGAWRIATIVNATS